MAEVIAFIGLGANLETPAEKVREAIARMGRIEKTRVLQAAPLHGSKPVGPPGQADYVNTAAKIATHLPPADLLAALKGIERAMGRVPAERWGPRLIDLDILLYGDQVIAGESLVIPHPQMAKRRFVLEPLADIAPDLVVPGHGRTVSALLADLGPADGSVWRVDRP